MNVEEIGCLAYLKFNVILLKEYKMSKYMEDRISTQNVIIFYQLSTKYKLASLAKTTFCCIERCFTQVAENRNFLELDYTNVSKIIASSGLHIHSELEVFNLADNWISYDSEKRSKYASSLLSKVRLNLLSSYLVKCLSNKSPSFSNIEECTKTYNICLNNIENGCKNKSEVYIKNRYCNQNMFNVLMCGGRENIGTINVVNQFAASNLQNVELLPSMLDARCHHKAICLKGDVYLLGGEGDMNNLFSVEKYSTATKTWENVAKMHNILNLFCACAFMEKIFIFGGCYYVGRSTSSCLQLDVKSLEHKYHWNTVGEMNTARKAAACTVFEERVVVSGGWDDHSNQLNTVESYDVIADKWSTMANMIHARSGHSLVTLRHKLYVIGSNTSEVFENTCKKFVALKSPFIRTYSFVEAIPVGNKIVVFQHYEPLLLCYDVDKDKWSEEPCDVTNHRSHFSCVKVPTF